MSADVRRPQLAGADVDNRPAGQQQVERCRAARRVDGPPPDRRVDRGIHVHLGVHGR